VKPHVGLLVGGSIGFVEFLVENVYILEEHVGGEEFLAEDLTVEGESQWLVIRILVVESDTTVAKGFVVVRFEVIVTHFDVWR
jgi:hypothetical protein